MSLLRRRAKSRTRRVHGDNGCEIQGEAGPRERAQDNRAWAAEVSDEVATSTANRGGTAGQEFDGCLPGTLGGRMEQS